MADRSIAPRQDIVATLTFAGISDRGGSRNETRVITGLTVTNNSSRRVGVEIEEEETKLKFSGTINPGQTRSIPVLSLTQHWNTDSPIGGGPRWDGLNIRYRDA